jgi:hypothetical protein
MVNRLLVCNGDGTSRQLIRNRGLNPPPLGGLLLGWGLLGAFSWTGNPILITQFSIINSQFSINLTPSRLRVSLSTKLTIHYPLNQLSAWAFKFSRRCKSFCGFILESLTHKTPPNWCSISTTSDSFTQRGIVIFPNPHRGG